MWPSNHYSLKLFIKMLCWLTFVGTPAMLAAITVFPAQVPVGIFSPLQPKLLASLDQRYYRDVKFTSDRKLLGATAEGVLVSDTGTWSLIGPRYDMRNVRRLAVAEHKPIFVSANNHWWQLWDLESHSSKALHNNKIPIEAVALSADGKVLAIGDQEGNIPLWDIERNKPWDPPLHGDQGIYQLSLSPNAELLAAKDAIAPTLLVWSLPTRKLHFEDKYRRANPVTLAFSPCGRYLAVFSNDGRIHFYDSKSGRHIVDWMAGYASVLRILFSPDSRVLATGGSKENDPAFAGEVRFWEAASRKEILTFPAHEGGVYEMALSFDGRMLAVVGRTNEPEVGYKLPPKIWDVSAIMGTKGARSLKRVSTADLERLWTSLAASSPARAYEAINLLAAGGNDSVHFLSRRLAPIQVSNDPQVERLIGQLDSARDAKRDAAMDQLKKLDSFLLEPLLRRALSGPLSEDARSRVGQILIKIEKDGPLPEQLRSLRALAVLERIGTSEAMALLRRIGTGNREARFTQDASSTLERLQKQKDTAAN